MRSSRNFHGTPKVSLNQNWKIYARRRSGLVDDRRFPLSECCFVVCAWVVSGGTLWGTFGEHLTSDSSIVPWRWL